MYHPGLTITVDLKPLALACSPMAFFSVTSMLDADPQSRPIHSTRTIKGLVRHGAIGDFGRRLHATVDEMLDANLSRGINTDLSKVGLGRTTGLADCLCCRVSQM